MQMKKKFRVNKSPQNYSACIKKAFLPTSMQFRRPRLLCTLSQTVVIYRVSSIIAEFNKVLLLISSSK